MRQEYSISTVNLSKAYRLYSNKLDIVKEALNPFRKSYHDEFFALKNINLNVKKGDILGIVGPNGAGKSTLLKLISGILVPSSGKINVDGKISSLLNPGEGFNPDFTGYENIRLHCIINGYNKSGIDDQVKKIEEFADIGRFISQPFRTYSSGMKARLAFAAAVNVNPDILVIDEVMSVGDELFRRKCFRKMEEFFNSGKTVLFVSHDMEIITAICTNAIFVNNGEIEYEGRAEEVVNYYDHFIQSFNNKTEMIEKIKKHYSQKIDGRKSLAITTSKNDIRISDFTIRSEDGAVDEYLISGNSYLFRFNVQFGSDAGLPDYFISFKDEKGVRISSFRYHNSYSPEPYSKYQVECFFKCHLLKGSYFIDVGIGKGSLDNLNLSAIGIDVFSFTVKENLKTDLSTEFNGYFYLDQVVSVRKIEKVTELD